MDLNKWVPPVTGTIVLLALVGCSSGSGSEGGVADSGDSATYTIGGTVSGLAGTGLMLQNNAGDNLAIGADGAFVFATEVAAGGSYSVAVSEQPTAPSQSCVVTGASGTVGSADVASISISCLTVAYSYSIVDTDQVECYDSGNGAETSCPGAGYDGDYAGYQPSYDVSADGLTVADDVTGLIWTQSPDTDGDGDVDSSDKKTQTNAVTYCGNLSTGGYSWRLPTIKQLFSLILFSGRDPSGFAGTDTSQLTPFIDASFARAFGDTAAGERIIDGQYVTTTNYLSTTMYGNNTMFGVNFVDGRIKGYPVDGKEFYVLCVTGNEEYGVNDYVYNSDATISDNATGLMWEEFDSASTDWDDAISTCEGSVTGTHTDWRLPNVKELQSIVDYTRSPDTDASAAIDPIFSSTSLINEGGGTDWGYYWASTTHANMSDNGRNGTYVSFGRALGYFQSGVTDVHGAGAQRSNDKLDVSNQDSANVGFGPFYYFGPQGDIGRIDNKVRCVRDDFTVTL